MTDKNLFLHDLAVVAIMKDEEPYVKEWIDYHLLAGVNHFYIYDNESTPEFKKILQPYIDAGVVTYKFYPGKARQYTAYNDAFKRFRFQCRYMPFIDADEFIFPKSKPTIIEIVDEIFGDSQTTAALGVNWLMFGSNNLKKADFSRGVLERFTMRCAEVNHHTKAITNPRRIKFFQNPHFATYYEGTFSVNEHGEKFGGAFNETKTVDKIAIHHYHFKTREEYAVKVNRGSPTGYSGKNFAAFDEGDKTANEIFDDAILKYRDAKLDALNADDINIFDGAKINYPQLFNALSQNLLQTTQKNIPQLFFYGKLETFLTCLNLTTYLEEKFIDKTAANFFREVSLNAVYKTLNTNLGVYDILFILSEMPKILKLKYPVVEKIRDACIKLLPPVTDTFRLNKKWQELNELEYTLDMLKTFEK